MADTCDHCGGPLRIYNFQRRKAVDQAQPVSCMNCGSSHWLLKGETGHINPEPLPSDSDGMITMPWRDRSTRPINAGIYECRFTDTDPHVLRLMWNGSHFSGLVDGQWKRIKMTTFRAWRGKWK